MTRTVELSEYESKLIQLFAWETAKTQQAVEFGQRMSKPRAVAEIARDTIIGKRAEVAIVKMLKDDFQVHLPINYEVYPDGCDDNDIIINNWSLDVKATRNGKWLLFEKSKVYYRKKTGTLPDIVVMCRTPWNDISDAPKDNSVEIIGCIGIGKLIRTPIIRAGDCLPGTRCKLFADNYAVPFGRLDDADKFHDYVSWMLKRGKNGTVDKAV